MGRSMLSTVALAGVMSCAALVAGCSSSPTLLEETATGSSSSDPSSGASATIAPTDFVSFGGITYTAQQKVSSRSVEREVLVGRVRLQREAFKYQAIGHQSDGSASFLEAGTPVRAVEGYAPSFRVAARRDGAWMLYEAAENLRAERGEDLLDIEGKVDYVGLRAPTGDAHKEVAAVREPSRVVAIAEAASGGPLRRVFDGPFLGYPVYAVVFHLEDGTESTRAYEPDSGELSLNRSGTARGVVLPEQVRGPIDRALRGARSEIVSSARPDRQ